jgi:uncharacterized protein (TIRG00374 family)
VVRLTLLAFGLFALIWLIWQVGPARILDAAGGLGAFALLIILLPSLLMYMLEAYGWRLTLGRYARAVSFWRLFAVRAAGEVINMTVPSYVGGEPVKAYLLRRYGVPLVDGFASVVLAKTTMTIAEIMFILVGVGLAFSLLASGDGAGIGWTLILGTAVSLGLLIFGTALFVIVQHRGLFTGLLGLLRRCRIRIPPLEAREAKLRDLDRTILAFYDNDRRAFLQSVGFFFLGWLAEALEAYAILYVLAGSVGAVAALAIGGLSAFIKGATFFIPGSLGAQDGGNVLLLVTFGYSDVAGVTFALLRRLREIVWIAIGLGLLALLGKSGNEETVRKTASE